jgi:glucose-1-phosphate adenylyltransferase
MSTITDVPGYLKNVLTMVLAGGRGERLYPLTKDRAKPSVPFGGIYRIIDFPLSNCLNSGLRRIYLLTQYKSISLDRHISQAWNILSGEMGEFIATIPPQQRLAESWYLGTADAIYQNIYTLQSQRPARVLILSGDHIYKMNYLDMLRFHEEKEAQITVACVEASIERAAGQLGVVEVDSSMRIVGFQEKPQCPKPTPHNEKKAFCSMGVYIFNTEDLIHCVTDDAKKKTEHDFGRNVIPTEIGLKKVFAYNFIDENKKEVLYWRDIGTTDAYYEANMDLVQVDPVFNLYDTNWPIRTLQPQMPPAKTVFADEWEGGRRAVVLDSLICHGCIISGGRVQRSILSPGVRVDDYAEVTDSLLFEDVHVGKGAKIRHTIVDKRVTIPENSFIGFDLEQDRKRFTVTDSGIVVIPRMMKLE